MSENSHWLLGSRQRVVAVTVVLLLLLNQIPETPNHP
jgi:hypothetical protein